MVIGIVGSRTLSNKPWAFACIHDAMTRGRIGWDDIDLMISGGAYYGGDKIAEEWADRHEVKKRIIYADWDRCLASCPMRHRKVDKWGRFYCPDAGKRRNTQVAQEIDVLIALLDVDSKTGGTDDTIQKVRELRKPVFVFTFMG